MAQVLQSSKCEACFHPKENHKEGEFCTMGLTCYCEHYVPPVLVEFIQKIEKKKFEYNTLYSRSKYLLENIPQIRIAGEKSFYACYIWIWHGFNIKIGSELNQEVWDRLPNQCSVNRTKRLVKEHYVNLRTYNKEVSIEQRTIYQALMEMVCENES